MFSFYGSDIQGVFLMHIHEYLIGEVISKERARSYAIDDIRYRQWVGSEERAALFDKLSMLNCEIAILTHQCDYIASLRQMAKAR
jgi:hypothetical protein